MAIGKVIGLSLFPQGSADDTFTLSPDLAEQLRRKRSIMLAHWRDFDQFFLPPHL